jgi:L-seryl-tRNA(Ser) seleniumtransferase
MRQWGLPYEPTPMDSLRSGADLVTFSGDKLLGGPQAGIIVGKRELIDKLKKNPLKRALRCDKLTLAALEAVLRLYASPERLSQRLPALRWLSKPQADIAAQVQRLLPAIRSWASSFAQVSSIEVMGQIGSGSLPVERLPSQAIALSPTGPGRSANRQLLALQRALLDMPIPIVGRIHDGQLLLDLRCLDEEQLLAEQFIQPYTP